MTDTYSIEVGDLGDSELTVTSDDFTIISQLTTWNNTECKHRNSFLIKKSIWENSAFLEAIKI